jgi:hypothetical protein
MDLYDISIEGSTVGCAYSNTYKVVATTIGDAVDKAVEEMQRTHKLENVMVKNVEFLYGGLIV